MLALSKEEAGYSGQRRTTGQPTLQTSKLNNLIPKWYIYPGKREVYLNKLFLFTLPAVSLIKIEIYLKNKKKLFFR